jgi:GT2 family glycosyltransferase
VDQPDQPDQRDEPFGPPSVQVEAVAPAVVVVMVAHDPGEWFEEALASVEGQTYRNTSLLVIDVASTTELAPRVAAASPYAHLQRLEQNVGFGPAANEVLEGVQGAAFYLFCHDDVRLEPDVVQVMVEEAFRSNAGIVGPKIVRWDEADRLLQVGMGADKTGAPAPYVERGELDQEQHDAVRDVFYVPGAATLVRADLFSALHGFDPDIELLGEDLDFAWRAHVVGARVLVAPAARVAHLEALAHRRPIDDRRRLQMRHRLRSTHVCYRLGTRLRVLPQAAAVALVEFVYGVLTGRFRHAGDVVAAWWWNLRHRRTAVARRRLLAAERTVDDHDVRRLQVHGSARWSAFLRGQGSAPDNRLGAMTASGREMVTNLRSARARSSLLAWAAVLLVLGFGSRELITSGVPAVGQFLAFPGHPSSLLQQWVSGFRSVGLGSEAPAPTLFGVLGVLGYLCFGAMGFLRTAAIVGALPIGALGIWRLAGPLGSRRARITSLVVYVCIPIGFNAMARGRWDGLVMYGLVPWMINQLARGSRLAPFGDVGGLRGQGVVDRPVLQRILLLAGEVRGMARTGLVAVGGALVAMALQLPWSLHVATNGWRDAIGLTTTGGEPLALDRVLRFATGPYGTSALGWAFLIAGALVLAIGRAWRLRWAVRCWVVVAGGFAAVLVSQGLPPGWMPAPEVLLAPSAAALALAAGLGMVAFEADLPDYHFGWRQLASVVAGAALIVGVAPALAASLGGQWGLPGTDFDSTVGHLGSKISSQGPYRVLWVGEANLLPGSPWLLDEPEPASSQQQAVLAYTMTDQSMAQVTDLLPGPDDGATARVAESLQIAARGGTTRLGALLAPMGIRYVVVPTANAPLPYDTGPTYHPTQLLAALQDQLDLADVDVISGVAVFRNTAWGPVRAELPADTHYPSGGPSISSRIVPGLAGARPALVDQSSYQSFHGGLANPTSVYLAQSASGRWRFAADGHAVAGTKVLGWAEAFDSPAATSATLHYDTPPTRDLWLLGQVVLWLAVLIVLFRNRVRAQGERDLALLHLEGELA